MSEQMLNELRLSAKRLIVATPEIVNHLGFSGSPSDAVWEYVYNRARWSGSDRNEAREMARQFKVKSELGEWTPEEWEEFREEARKYGKSA